MTSEYELDNDDVVNVLLVQPQLIEYADLSKISGCDWSWILSKQPQLIEYADLSKISGWDWRMILIEQPQLIEYADLSILNGYDWSWILGKQPQLIFFIFFKYIKNKINIFKYLYYFIIFIFKKYK
jgi:hypothetical protein